MEAVFFWIVFSLIVGAIGGQRQCGFGKAFLLSLLISPLLGGLFTLTSPSLQKLEEMELLRKIAKSQTGIVHVQSTTKSSGSGFSPPTPL